MEFPDLGAHCSEPSCQRLDFLPLKCDACSGIFCADHVAYAQHHCGSAYQKDIQVPVCPLCNVPVPVARGEPPDRAVGEHIDRDCRSDPAQQKRKIFTNKCERPGCRQREMMKLTCERCGRNFCIKHRHPLDHDCSGEGHPTSRAGLAAISRAQGLASTSTVPSPSRTLPSSTSPSRARAQSPSQTAPPVIALQSGLSEDEALQRALELSLAETKPQSPSSQEEEDLALAQALSASEAEYRQQQQVKHVLHVNEVGLDHPAGRVLVGAPLRSWEKNGAPRTGEGQGPGYL
uniref:Zinc finger AN1-type containing 2B n=1 Tax=Equus caballus TaxID=9796 RepID=A0A3Q2LGQ7_HORSE